MALRPPPNPPQALSSQAKSTKPQKTKRNHSRTKVKAKPRQFRVGGCPLAATEKLHPFSDARLHCQEPFYNSTGSNLTEAKTYSRKRSNTNFIKIKSLTLQPFICSGLSLILPSCWPWWLIPGPCLWSWLP